MTYPGLLGVFESKLRAEELAVTAVKAANRLGSPQLFELAKYVVQRDR
jgi:geranylgeranyl diphosphate synthase type II